MDSDNQEQYLQQLQEFIYDEDKIVTFSWLSTKLEIDVHKSKSLLSTFITDQNATKSIELGITYIISGILEASNCLGIMLVKGDQFEDKKKLFKQIQSEFVYSVQKNKQVDLNGVGMVDMFDVNSPRSEPMLGSIIGKDCIKRILKVKKAIAVAPRVATTDKTKGSHLFGKASNSAKVEVKVEPKIIENNDKKLTNTKAKAPLVKNGGIASFFSKGSNTKPEVIKQIEIKKEKDTKEDKMEVDDDDTETEVEIIEEIKLKKVTPKSDQKAKKKSTLYDSGTDEEALKIEEANKKKISQNGSAKKKKPNKRQRKDASEERQQKKRKRIVIRNNSDSDDIFGGDEEENEEEIVPNSEEDEPVFKKTKAPLAAKNKNRKLVDKTYTDEDGYIVTKKEWVVESGSEDTEEESKEQKNPQLEQNSQLEQKKETKKEIKKTTPKETKKVTPPKDKAEVSPTKGVKGKKAAKVAGVNQPTLMSFFKKK